MENCTRVLRGEEVIRFATKRGYAHDWAQAGGRPRFVDIVVCDGIEGFAAPCVVNASEIGLTPRLRIPLSFLCNAWPPSSSRFDPETSPAILRALRALGDRGGVVVLHADPDNNVEPFPTEFGVAKLVDPETMAEYRGCNEVLADAFRNACKVAGYGSKCPEIEVEVYASQ